MKKILYFFAGCIVIGLLISTFFAALPVFTITGKGFLAALSEGNYEQPYAMCSKSFKQKYTIADFKRIIDHSGLNDYKSVEWVENVNDDQHKSGYLLGVVLTKDNKRIMIKLNFIQEIFKSDSNKRWRIDAITIDNERFGQ